MTWYFDKMLVQTDDIMFKRPQFASFYLKKKKKIWREKQHGRFKLTIKFILFGHSFEFFNMQMRCAVSGMMSRYSSGASREKCFFFWRHLPHIYWLIRHTLENCTIFFAFKLTIRLALLIGKMVYIFLFLKILWDIKRAQTILKSFSNHRN